MYIVLFGHGSFDGQAARFNLPGPDMTAAEFNAMLRKLPRATMVFVNTASASGPFVEDAVGPGPHDHHGDTQRGRAVRDALRRATSSRRSPREAADADKNKRISMLEAFQYAKAEVARAYEREGLLATEHAMLDDNGDKKAARRRRRPRPTASWRPRCRSVLPRMPRRSPRIRSCARCYLERRDLERRVESLRLLKDSMPPAKYASELERLVTDLALKTREIRSLEGDPQNHE